MTVEMLNTLSFASFIASGVMFLTAVALFFLLDIPKVVGEVSGKTAKKSIQQIQKHNEQFSLVGGNLPQLYER